MNQDILAAAVASMFIGILGKIIWDWLKNNRSGGNQNADSCALADKKVGVLFKSIQNAEAIMEQMKDIHSQKDADGRPLFYMPSRTIQQVDAIDSNTKTIQATLTMLLEEIKASNKALLEVIKKN